MADAEKLYMNSPLVRWVETFKANDGHPLEYQDLFDGVFLNDVMQQIDPRLADNGLNRGVEDLSGRLHNWGILVKNIQGYYRDVLQQLLVICLPNINAICREPGKESSFMEIRKALLLILGCAVQCEQKEDVIDKIMALDIITQTEIVENIKEVTDDCKTVLPIQRPDTPSGISSYLDKTLAHLYRLIQERDQYAELAADLGLERDVYMSQAEGKPVIGSPQKSPDKHHLALELAECKAKLRHLRQELEDKQEQMLDLKDELQASLADCNELKNKNTLLVQESRGTRLLRDELDIMKEKAMKVDVYEKEILRYKEKLIEFEFFKARTEELKEDNSILEETKAMLEDQLTSSRKRIETVVELESKLARCRQEIEELNLERESDQSKIEYLTEKNVRLEFEKKSHMNDSVSLEAEMAAAKSVMNQVGSSLSEQLSETSHTRILRLELENQRLAAKLAEMKETALIQSAEVSLQLEKENQRLVKKIEKLEASTHKTSEQLVRTEIELSSAKEERDRLLKSVENVNEKSEQQIQELEKENEQLSQALHQIRERVEKTSDLKVKDLEKDNRRLLETVTTKNSQLNKLEFDNRQLQRSCHQFQENTVRLHELEQENQVLEKENTDLIQKVASLQHAADRLEAVEQESSDLTVENHKLQKTVETLQKIAQRREQEEQDHISISLENQRLQRTLESLKSEADRTVELESEKNDLNSELRQLKKLLEGQEMQKLKQEQLEIELLNMRNENQRLQKSLEVTARRIQQLEKENADLESDKEKISQELDSLKVTTKQLEEKDLEVSLFEVEVLKLQKDKTSLEKENRKLKQSLDLKASSLEELGAKVMTLNQEMKSQRVTLEKMKETCSKVKDLEKENKELLQELSTDRKTLTTLREDLVNEKIRSQELSNELEQLTSELEKIGLDTEKLTMAEQTNDAKYKALETMIEETLKKSSELKEKKILMLESRLDESKSRNLKLQEDLRSAKRESEILRQRLEEESAEKVVLNGRKEEGHRSEKSIASSAAQEIFQLKDHLVELERQNATLMAETDNLRCNNHSSTEQCLKLETQLTNIQSQHAALQNHYSSLQEQNAKLQVECSTLHSQTSSALTQKDMLKNQLSSLETEFENLAHKYEGLQSTHLSFVSDHESLQHLHQQLTSEYESLVAEHGSLKTLHKSLKLELKDLHEQHEVLLEGKDDVNKVRDVMEREREQLKRELMSLGNLKNDHQHLRESHHQLRSAFDKLSNDYSSILASHKQIKTDYNSLQLKTTELQGELSEAKENLSVADMEFQKLENRMETVYQINERIDNENQALLMQIKQLLNQNHELLMQALNSKDHFVEEEKAYLEKLSELRRQKERLEEKIMEHYKNRISPKKKGLGALIARKARGIMSKGTRRSKSRNNLTDLTEGSPQRPTSPDQSSDGLHKVDKTQESCCSCTGSLRSKSPDFSRQKKSLAKSYTVLDFTFVDLEQIRLRGARSNEDINSSANTDGGFLEGRPFSINGGQKSGGHEGSSHGPIKKLYGLPSQENEVITLKQFLMEANNAADSYVSDDSALDELRSPDQNKQQMSSDNESRKSDHSSTSSGLLHQQRHPQQPLPHQLLTQQQQPYQQPIRNGVPISRQDVFDVAPSSLGSAVTRELSGSKISYHSTESGSEISCFDSDGVLPGGAFSSSPKGDGKISEVPAQYGLTGSGNIVQQRPSSVSGSNLKNPGQEYSPLTQSKWGNMNQPNSLPRNVSQTPPTSNQPPHSSFIMYNRARELPTDSLPAGPLPDCPDRLILSAAQEGQLSPHYAQPFKLSTISVDSNLTNNWSNSRENSGNNVKRDLSGRLIRETEAITSESLSGHLQSPVMRTQQRAHVHQSQDGKNPDVSGYMPRRPLSQIVSSQNLHQRARPASVMGHTPLIKGVYSRPPGEGRPRQHQRQQSGSNGQEPPDIVGGNTLAGQVDQSGHTSRSQYHRPHVPERSKSVPPHLFNRIKDLEEDDQKRDLSVSSQSGTRNEQEITSRGEIRQTPVRRDILASKSSSNISLIREPSRRQSGSRPASQSISTPVSQSLSVPVSQSLEPDVLRESYQTPPTFHPQQRHSSYGSQMIIDHIRHSGVGSTSHMSFTQQDQALSSHNPFPQQDSPTQRHKPQFYPGSQASPQLSAVEQLSLSRPDYLPLSTQEHREYKQTRPILQSDTVSHYQPQALPRSHSSLGNPTTRTPPTVLSPGDTYGKSNMPFSNILPGQSQVRHNTPPVLSPTQAHRSSTHSTVLSPGQSLLSPGQSHFTPGQSHFTPGQPHLRSSISSSNPLPGAPLIKSSNLSHHPGRQEYFPNQHDQNNRYKISSQHGAEYPTMPVSNNQANPHCSDRDFKAPQSGPHPRDIPSSPYSNSLSPPQPQYVTTSQKKNSPGNPPQPPPRSSSRGVSQYQRSESPISNGLGGQHASLPQQTRLSVIIQPNSNQPQLSPHETLNNPNPSTGLSAPQANISELPPQSKSSSNIPVVSDRGAEGAEPKTKNSIWYEYGCV